VRRRTKVTAAVAIAAALTSAWWVLRAPSIERHAIVAPPDLDIDPPAMRARRDAAIALAKTPDDPWTFAESLPSSAPDTDAKKEQCGQDDAPKFRAPDDANGDIEAVQTKAASPNYGAARSRIAASLLASSDPLDRAVADFLNVDDMRTPAGLLDAVVQQAAGTSDARIYAFAYGLCHSGRGPPASCRSLSTAAWARIGPGNGAPWLEALGQARAQGDAAGAQDAMSHLASASRFDTYAFAPIGAIASRGLENEADLAAASEMTEQVLGQSLAPSPPYQALTQACSDKAGGNEAVLRQCLAISDVMFDHSDTLMARAVGGVTLYLAAGDASRRDLFHAEQLAFSRHWSPATGFSECKTLREQAKRLLRRAQIGEVEAQREQARQFVAP
jgi:hypothetical protein